MKIICNGQARDVEGETLAVVLEELGLAGVLVATAVNGAFVPVSARALAALKPGDAIEVVAPMKGG